MRDGQCRQIADGGYLGARPTCRFFDALQDVDNPLLPCLAAGHFEQQSVIFGLVPDDMATEVKNRQCQQIFLDYEQAIQNSTSAAGANARVTWVNLMI